jgi:hypothetical protein
VVTQGVAIEASKNSPERKEAVLRKVLPPQSKSVVEVANEKDIPYNTSILG